MQAIIGKLSALSVAAFCLAVAIAIQPAAAQTYVDEYKAYNAAIEAGDTEAAARHGYAAWQAAEAELGDDGLTAILAYNYGQLILFSDAENAAKALRRAEALRAEGVADLPVSELRLYLAYAEFALDGGASRKRNELREALFAIDAEGYPPSYDTAAMWSQLATADLFDKRYDAAFESAVRAETAIATVSPENYRRRAEMLLVGGIAKIVSRSSKANDLIMANQLLVRGGKLFPAQESIDNFDPVLAQIIAWNNAAGASLMTLSNIQAERFVYASRIKLASPDNDYAEATNTFLGFDTSAIFPKELDQETCGIEWVEQEPPNYPREAENKGYIGGAVIGYNFGDDTKVHDAVIISEVPSDKFGQTALDSMAEWRLARAPLDHPDCRSNYIFFFSFVFAG